MNAGQHELAALRIREAKHRIVESWESCVRRQLSGAREHDKSALVDSLPDVLDRLAELVTATPGAEAVEASISGEHGQQRAALPSYSLEQLIIEYELLHQIVVKTLHDGGVVDHEAHGRITRAILTAIRIASSEFARIRAQKTSEELKVVGVRFQHMVEAVEDYAIFTLNPDGYITSWNEGCVRMKLYTVEEAVGQHFAMLYPEEGVRRDEPMAHLRSAALEGRFRGEGVRVRKNGEHFLADVSITAIYDDGRLTGYTKVVQDLSERNVLIQERDLSRTDSMRLRADAEYRERFVTTLTHDLRQPLSTAKTASDLIAQYADDSEKVRNWALKMSAALDRADRMIGDLLDANRLHAGQPIPLELERFNLRTLAEEMIRELTPAHGDRFRIESDGPITGNWSKDGLRRVLENLLSNAIKYGDDKVITIRIRGVGGRVLLSVHNFGTIIPVEEQQRLFEAFHRAGAAKSSGKQGWGIGLALVKGIVEAHHGIIKAESYPKEGTTFTADLPLDAAQGSRDPEPISVKSAQ